MGAVLIGYGGTPAGAADTFPAPASSWYWADQIQPLGAVCAPSPAPPDACVFPLGQAGQLPAPDVPKGDLAVSARNGGINKVAVVTVDLSAVPENATLSDAALRLVEDTSGGNQNTATNPAILATPVDYYASNQDARPIGEAPDMTGQPQKPGARALVGTDNVWTFDVTGLLNNCLANFNTSCGIGLRPPYIGSSQTFQAVWYGPRTTTTDSPTVTPAKKPSVSATVVPGSGTETTTTTVFTEPFEPSIVPTSPPVEEPLTTPFLSVGPPVSPPAVAPTSTTIPFRRVTTPTVRRTSTDRTPPVAFFLAALGLIGLLGSSMVALGPMGEPVPARRGSVLRTLERMGAAPEDKE